MNDWSTRDGPQGGIPVAEDALVDVLYEDADSYQRTPARCVDWERRLNPVVMWRIVPAQG